MISFSYQPKGGQANSRSIFERYNYLSKVSRQLTSSLDYKTTLSNIADVLVPEMADWFAVDILEKGKIKLIEVKHPHKKALYRVKDLRKKYPVTTFDPVGIGNVIRTGQPEFYQQITPKMLMQNPNSEEREMYLKLKINSAMIIPLKARSRVLGALTFVYSGSKRFYRQEDLAVAEDIGNLAGLAIENSKLYQLSRAELEKRQKIDEDLAHLAAIVKSSDDAILSQDLNGIITSWNPASQKTYGYSAKEAIGKHITMLFPLELKDEFPKIMGKIKKGKKIKHYDTVRLRKDGQKVYVSISVSPIKDRWGQILGASIIGRNINDRVELERRKDDFIVIASHELKTPLTSLKGFTQILMKYTNNQDPKMKGFIKRMNDQVDKLNTLVGDLLDVSRIKSGRVKLKKEPFKVNDLISQIAGDMQHSTSHHRIIFDLKAGGRVKADKYRIGQVLVNLISNAIKYSPKADKIIVSSKSNSKYTEVSIQDFGIGIFPQDQKHIFEKFYQARSKIRESFAGLGLGLFISLEIISRHKGKFIVKSAKGKGSIFSFTLPQMQ